MTNKVKKLIGSRYLWKEIQLFTLILSKWNAPIQKKKQKNIAQKKKFPIKNFFS